MDLVISNQAKRRPWVGKEVNLLSAWTAQRVPYEEQARRLGRTLGSVCGKVDRMGIGLGLCDDQRSRQESPCWAEPDAAHHSILHRQEMEADARTDTVALADLEDKHCRFVLGDPAKARCCGHKRVPGKSYCNAHVALCSHAYGAEIQERMSVAGSYRLRTGQMPQRRMAGRLCANLLHTGVDARNMEIAVDRPNPA